MSQKEFTGRHFLVIVVSAFALIIGVNLLLAYKAISTFPGLEVENSYVASQNFNRDRAAQEALGWTVALGLEASNLVLSITDSAGLPVRVAKLGGTFGRATEVVDDQTPEFLFDGTNYVAPVKLTRGNWNLRMIAYAQDGTKFRQRLVLHIKE
jgi:nitrogen fixation protein FixH